MTKQIITYVMVLCLTAGLSTTALAVSRSSTSYSIPSETMGSSGGVGASSAYSVFGILSSLNLGPVSSSSYGIGQGFLSSSFAAVPIVITAIDPALAYNTGLVSASLTGSGFVTGAAVKLTRSGEPDVIATNVNVVDATKITCILNITGLVTGAWNVAVVNPDGQSGLLANGFTVKTWAMAGLLVNYPNPFNPTIAPTTIVYQLAADANASVLIFNLAHELVYKQDFMAGSAGGRTGDNSVTWNGISRFNEMAANGVYFCRVIDRNSGKILAKGKIAVLK